VTRDLAAVAGLTAIYLSVLTSLHPGDVAIGVALAAGVVVAVGRRPPRAGAERSRPAAIVRAFAATAVEMVRGSWRTARFCLGAAAEPGFVEIPRDDRRRGEVALWGVLTGEAPDELPVDVDDERDVLIVHVIDASDPDAIRMHHAAAHARFRRGAVR
jgi:multisubunit Na+/H+ antiporter MnhE subunit